MTPCRCKLVRLFVNLVLTLAGALGLLALIERLPISMPYPVQRFLQMFIAAMGREELDNPDDMFGLAFLLYLSVSLIAAAAIVFACNVAIARQRAKRRHAR